MKALFVSGCEQELVLTCSKSLVNNHHLMIVLSFSLALFPTVPESYKHLAAAGIKVKKCILREKAANILKDYVKTGEIYQA